MPSAYLLLVVKDLQALLIKLEAASIPSRAEPVPAIARGMRKRMIRTCRS
jgi:hypothetical protein